MTPTPLIKLENIYLKREDKNLTGSAKDRAISCQIQNLINKNFKEAVISSTGNAAISASYFCSLYNIKLTIFLSPKVDKEKLELIKNYTNNIFFSDKPISQAFKYSKKNNAYLLRQSTDPSALIGYHEIGKELLEQLTTLTSIFIPVGSGTTLLGISQALPSTVKVFAIQPANNCPLSKLFDQDYIFESNSVTDALTVKTLPLKSQILEKIKSSNGTGLIVQNSDILNAQDLLKKNNIITSNESALALAGLHKALKQNISIGDYPVVLLTGAQR